MTYNDFTLDALKQRFGLRTDDLRLTGDLVSIDAGEYHIKEVERIVGILVAMVRGAAVPPQT